MSNEHKYLVQSFAQTLLGFRNLLQIVGDGLETIFDRVLQFGHSQAGSMRVGMSSDLVSSFRQEINDLIDIGSGR